MLPSSYPAFPSSAQNDYMKSFGGYSAGVVDPSAFVNQPGATSFSNFQTAYPSGYGGGFDAGSMSPGIANVAPMAGGGMFDGLKSWWDKTPMMGSTDDKGMKTDGILGSGLAIGDSFMKGYMGMQMYGLAKDTFENNKAQFAKNFGMQKATLVANAGDLAAGRSGATPESIAAYKKQFEAIG